MSICQVEGSVDEDSTKSDEEYDDLAMRDGLENGYWSDDDCPESTNIKRIADDQEPIDEGDGVAADEYQHNLEHIFKRSEGVVEPSLPCTLPCEINETRTGQRTRRRSLSDSMELQYRTRSTPAASDELRALQKSPVLAVTTRYGPMASCWWWLLHRSNKLWIFSFPRITWKVWFTTDSVMLNQCQNFYFLVLNSWMTTKEDSVECCGLAVEMLHACRFLLELLYWIGCF